MRDAIILPHNYELLLIYEAERSGVIKQLYNLSDDLYDEYDLDAGKKYYQQLMDEKISDKQNLFRMLLLFDDIILSNATQDYAYDNLIKTGMFSIFYMEDALEADPIHQDGHIEYATYLKPAILPVFEDAVKPYFKYGQAVDGFSNFVSDLYDCILLKKQIPSKHCGFIKYNKALFDKKNIDNIRMLKSKFGDIPSCLTSRRFFSDISGLLCALYESLCWQLEISSKKDAAIIDCDFELANIGCEEYVKDISGSMEAYNILKVECGKIIGELPQINSIQEVFQLKEKRHRDIHNLKQELSGLEYEIRNGNSVKAVEKAAEDIRKASKALSKGHLVSRVTKWTNVFLIPIGIASMFMSEPQISIGAGILSVVGRTSNFIETTMKDKNKWFEIIF